MTYEQTRRLAWIMRRLSPYCRTNRPEWLSYRDFTVYATGGRELRVR